MGDVAITFRAHDLSGERLRSVLSRQFEYQQARAFRQELIPRLGMLGSAGAALAFGMNVVPHRPAEALIALLVSGAGVGIAAEWRARLRLMRELAGIPAKVIPLPRPGILPTARSADRSDATDRARSCDGAVPSAREDVLAAPPHEAPISL